MKRQPTLADEYLAAPRDILYAKQFQDTTRANLLEAKRFVLDEKATAHIATMLKDHPRIVADAQEFAIPPFKKTWIELPALTLWQGVNEFVKPDLTHDNRLGFLIVGNHVRVLANVVDSKDRPALMPIEYHLWQPLDLKQELDLCALLDISRLSLDHLYWGSSFHQLMNDKDKEGLRALRDNHGMNLIPMLLPTKSKEDYQHIILENAGDLRNLIGTLLFLNRTQDMLHSVQVSHARGMIGHKAGTFLSHTVITLHVDPKVRLQKLVAGEGVWRRLHDVRGHFCHNERARQAGIAWCQHEWEEYEPLRWHCTLCEGKRWWRHEHQRGHEEKGLVTSEYRVTE